jgi:hypothetical protein
VLVVAEPSMVAVSVCPKNDKVEGKIDKVQVFFHEEFTIIKA